MSVNMSKIGARVQGLRENLGLTVGEVALKTHYTQKSILLMENGRATVDVDFLVALCGVLNVTPNDILQGEYNQPTPAEGDTDSRIDSFIERLDEIKSSELSRTRIKDTEETINEIKAMVDQIRTEERRESLHDKSKYKERRFNI